MRKNIYRLFLIISLTAFVFSGCAMQEPETDHADIIREKTVVRQVMTAEAFDKMLLNLPMAAVKAEKIVSGKGEELSESIRIVIKNNTDTDIKNASIAFALWDKENNPIMINEQKDPAGGKYIRKTDYTQVNMLSGGSFEKDVELSFTTADVAVVKAIAVSFENFDGEIWENPYFEQFCEFYGGRAYSKGEELEVKILESEFLSEVEETIATGEEDAEKELEEILESQAISVVETEYVIQDEDNRALYPDMLRVIIENNTGVEIKDIKIAYVAWDENNLPVKITGTSDFDGGKYLNIADFTDINAKSGKTWGENDGFPITEINKIASFKAIIVSYKTADGKTWENPCFEQFCELYNEKKLREVPVSGENAEN